MTDGWLCISGTTLFNSGTAVPTNNTDIVGIPFAFYFSVSHNNSLCILHHWIVQYFSHKYFLGGGLGVEL